MERDGDLIILRWRNKQILQTPLFYCVSRGWLSFYHFLDCGRVSNACVANSVLRQITLELGKN